MTLSDKKVSKSSSSDSQDEPMYAVPSLFGGVQYMKLTAGLAKAHGLKPLTPDEIKKIKEDQDARDQLSQQYSQAQIFQTVTTTSSSSSSSSTNPTQQKHQHTHPHLQGQGQGGFQIIHTSSSSSRQGHHPHGHVRIVQGQAQDPSNKNWAGHQMGVFQPGMKLALVNDDDNPVAAGQKAIKDKQEINRKAKEKIKEILKKSKK